MQAHSCYTAANFLTALVVSAELPHLAHARLPVTMVGCQWQVRTFYTAPTLIRALEAAGDKFVTKSDLSSLKILGTVGEPINAKAWNWYNKVIGGGRCPIVDTWWQTETGAILLTPLPGAWNLKPGSATLPFFGVQPVLLDEKVSRFDMQT